jgi:inhibitor of KinA
MPEYKVLPAGDTALVVEFGEHIDRQLSTWVLTLARRLNDIGLDGIVETVPTFRSLMVYYDPLTLPTAAPGACPPATTS